MRRVLGLGLLGSVGIAAGSVATGRLARTPAVRSLVSLRHQPWVGPWGQVLLFVGLLVLTVAWVLLGVLVRRGGCGPRAVVVTALAWAAPLMVAPPAFSADVWSYVANGMIAARGLSPYHATPVWLTGPIVHAVSAKWRYSPSPYGPIPLLWGEATARLTPSLWLGLLSFRLLALVAFLLLAAALVGVARVTHQDPARALWLVIASPFTLVHGLDSAHVDLLMAALGTLSVWVALRGRWVGAILLLGCAASVKVPALLGVVPVALALLLTRRHQGRWSRTWASGTVGLGALATLLVLGLASGFGTGWVAGLRSPLTVVSPLSMSTQLGRVLAHLSGAPDVPLVQSIGAVLVVACGAWSLLRPAVLTPEQAVTSGALFSTAAVFLSPVVHLWYFFWCLPLLASLPLGSGLRRTGIAVTALFGLLAPLDASQHLPRATGWQALALVLAVAAGLVPWRVHEAVRPRQKIR